MIKIYTAEQVKGVLLGIAVGDALGVPAEFQARGTFEIKDMVGGGHWNQPAGTWSDDTSLALGLAEALTADQGKLLDNAAKNFVRWYEKGAFTAHGKLFDIGTTTVKAIHKLQQGVPPTESGCTRVNENGNGSLMRIAPLVFYVADKPQGERFEIVRQVSAITHAHDISVIACIVYVEYLLKLLKGGDKLLAFKSVQEELETQFGIHSNDEMGRLFKRFFPLLYPKNKIWAAPENEIRSGGFVAETLEAAIWCFLTTDNYKDAVLKAVNLGSDTDTTAAVVGGLAGLFYGVKGIPQKWVTKLARHEDILNLADRLNENISRG